MVLMYVVYALLCVYTQAILGYFQRRSGAAAQLAEEGEEAAATGVLSSRRDGEHEGGSLVASPRGPELGINPAEKIPTDGSFVGAAPTLEPRSTDIFNGSS